VPVGYDSIHVEDLPEGGDFYLGYVNGAYANVAEIKARFPDKPVYGLTVLGPLGGVLKGESGVDTEPGNVDIPGAAQDIKDELAAGVHMPIGYTMVSWADALVQAVTALGVPRSQWRLLAAHYGAGQHICGPNTCGQLRTPADGTQCFDPGPYDISLVSNTFILASDYPGVQPVTPQDIANVVAAVKAALAPSFAAVASEIDHAITLVLYGDSEAAAEGEAVQGHPFNLLQLKTELDGLKADLPAIVAAAIKANPVVVPAVEPVDLKGTTATITFS
jgi:hypothetical protein